MDDRFGRSPVGLESPVSSSEVADVSSGDHEFSNPTRSLLVTGDGNLTIRLLNDQADLTLAVKAGFFPPFRITHVRRTSTASCIGFW